MGSADLLQAICKGAKLDNILHGGKNPMYQLRKLGDMITAMANNDPKRRKQVQGIKASISNGTISGLLKSRNPLSHYVNKSIFIKKKSLILGNM